MKDPELSKAIQSFIKTVDGLADDLILGGHPIPKENTKSFYLKCCWILSWLNKFESYKHDERIDNFRSEMKDLLPYLKEVKI
jgi:hypothetical protein